jgi:hypothetical protein
MPSLRLSGLDLARILMRTGYRMTGSACGHLLLERNSRAVTVPLLDELPAPLLRFLVLAAGVSLPQFTAILSGRVTAPATSVPPESVWPPPVAPNGAGSLVQGRSA